MADHKDKKKPNLIKRLFTGPSDEEIEDIQKKGLKKIREKAGTELEESKEKEAKRKKKELEEKLAERKIE